MPAIDEARDWLHSTVRGNPWSYRKARDEVAIAPLVSPLRFDVTIREAFFTFYAEHRDLYRSDFPVFAEMARDEEYFVWFRDIMCVAWQPHVLEGPELFAAAWEERLHSAAALYDSFERDGFDSRFPVTLHEGRKVLPTSHGKRLARSTYAGDGNHRLALLMAAGRKALLPSQYRIKRFRQLRPHDTTPQLLEALEVDEQRYLAFLRAGYPDQPDTAAEAELREVLRIDRPHLSTEAH